MKILINAASAGLGGALTFITNVLRELPGVAKPADRFIVIVPTSALEGLNNIIDNNMVELLPYPSEQSNALRRLYFDNWTIPQIVRERKADVLFSSTGFGTLRSPCPQILLVRNAAYFCPMFQRRYRELEASFHSTRIRRWIGLLSILAADIVVFPSRAMRETVASHIALAKKRTAVLHYGFSAQKFFQKCAAKPGIADKMEKWRNEGYKILLNVSHYAVHKNFETLIEALPSIIASGIKIKFVCTLSDRTNRNDSLREENALYTKAYGSLLERQRELGISDTVVHAGDFDHGQLHYLYERADVFVFPSFTESFGQPLVEAMSCGLPIVASDTAVNRELCGDAGRYFDTFDAIRCASALEETLRDADMRATMETRAIERSKDFSWTRYTASLVELCRRACL